MRVIQRLHSKTVAFALAGAMVMSGVPLSAFAEQPRFQAAERAAREAENPALQNEAAKSWDAFVVQVMGDSVSDPKWFFPALVMSVIPTVAIYRVRAAWNRNTINRYVLDVIKDRPDFKDPLAEINKSTKVASEELKQILVKAKSSDFRLIVQRLPAELQKEILKELKASGIKIAEKSEVTIEQILSKLNNLHDCNRRHYEVAKRLAPELERALKLEAGTISRTLKDPEHLLLKAYSGGSSLANPGAYTKEVVDFEKAILAQGARAAMTADVPLRGVPWWRVGANLSTRIFRKTWPVLLVGTTIVAGVLWYRAVATKERLATQAANTREVRAQDEEQAILKGVLYNEDALTLMVELGWMKMRDKYGRRFNYRCPVTFDNTNDVYIVAKAFEAANTQYTVLRKTPFSKDKEFSVEFFRTFWSGFFRFAAEERNPSLRNIRPEDLLGKNGDGADGIVGDLANESPSLFKHASEMIREYRQILAALKAQSARDRKTVLDSIREVDARQILERRLAQLDRLKEAGTDRDEDPD